MSTAKEEDNSWLIDLILSFFHSPEWKVPILSFIEENCALFFDEQQKKPEVDKKTGKLRPPSPENKLEYTIIHKEFKKLAEGLIEGMLQELGATPEQFGEAFEKAQNPPGYQKIAKVIESIDNYEIFARMMRKKNATINESAFKMLQDQDMKEAIKEGKTSDKNIAPIEETKGAPEEKQTKKERKKVSEAYYSPEDFEIFQSVLQPFIDIRFYGCLNLV